MTSSIKSHQSYQELTLELEEILNSLQSQNIDIDQVMAKHQRGIELIKLLEDYLSIAENTVIKTIQPSKNKKKTN
jgi:exodeoxyribonuclease VII small subunit